MNMFKNVKNRIDNSKIIKNPVFLVIGLLAVILVIALIYFIFLKYSPIMNFKYEGYAISGKEITENLLGASEETNSSKNIELTKIEEQGTIFKKLNAYFVGNKEKTEINLNYPIYINGNSNLYNLAENSTLISKDFEEISGYPNLSISEGKIYDGNDLERADGKEYIFVKTTDEIYINLNEVKIKTTANEYTIPVNSIIAFKENEIRYYTVNNNILVFNEINDIDNNSNVQIVENNYIYEELLTKLGILNVEVNDAPNNESQTNTIKENPIIEENNQTNTEVVEDIQEDNNNINEDENKEFIYVKPEVSVENFTADVYTAKSILTIKDPAGRIVEAPTFEFYKEGKIALRKVYTNSGNIIVTGLEPSTEYKIIGKFIYLNEEDQKVENTFYEGRISTKGYDSLDAIILSKENGEIYNNKIQVKNLKITSALNAEAIRGINKIELVANGIKTTLKNEQANMLIQGKEITVESSDGLKSNSKIDYELKIYDKNGVELQVENNKGETRTAKQEPIARVTVKEQDIVSVTLDLKLTDKDNANIENYKYVVTRANGEIVKEERLSKNENKIYLDELDSNQYYEIKIYADYSLEDGKGKQTNKEIGKLVFATKPLSTLGSIEMQIESTDIITTKATLKYKIDTERTDKRLIQILEKINIEIVEKDTQEIADSKEITGEEIEKLKLGETKEQHYTNLKSNTTYEIKISSKVKQGTKEEEIQVTYNYKEFTTLRSTAKVEIQNQFVTGELIDFDVRIEDKDYAVLNNKVRMELRDEDNNLIDLTEVETNKEYVRKTYDKLEENKKYKLSFYADQYNEGNTDETYKINYLIKELEIITEPGISGNIGLKSMLRKTTGKNLVDVESKVKWYTQCTGTWGYYEKTYNKEENTLRLWPGPGNNSQSYTYDLREYIGQEVTISFKIKTQGNISHVWIKNNKKNSTNTTEIKNLSNEEYIDYEQTLVVNDTGYLGILLSGISNSNTEDSYVYIKDLQIELGNRRTSYEPYQYNMAGEAIFSLEDKRNELVNNDYYIKVYENDTEISNIRYEDLPEENVIINGVKDINISENNNYKLELIVKIREREYVLSSFEFDTKNGEILGISSKEEYLDIQPEGNYIVLTDLDFSDISSSGDLKYRFGGRFGFNGTLDFNGHNVYINILPGGITPLFYIIESNGIIQNLNVKVYMNNELATNGNIIFYTNKGVIKNLMFTLEESKKAANRDLYLLGTNNQKTAVIENFVIKLNSNLYGANVSSVAYNSGKISNGYLYGESIEAQKYHANSINATLVKQNTGDISNIYSLIDINAEEIKANDYFAKLVYDNTSSGHIENVYTVGLGTGYKLAQGPNVTYGSGNVSNSYYMNDLIFTGVLDTKTTKKVLYNKEFQNRVLNNDGQFEVDELVSLNYYPQLKLPECMPRQEYISLPEVEDADLPDIVDTAVLEKENKRALIQMNVYNPAGETITNVQIKNVTTRIVSQEYLKGQSTVILELTDPVTCVSKYPIISMTTKGAYNLPYVREFEEGERYVNVDFYNEIWNIDDWKAFKKVGNQNYKLMADLDFKNEVANTYAGISLNGIFDGNNHTLQNINITPSYGVPLFFNIVKDSKVCNLYIKNYTINSNYYYLSVFGGTRNTTFENVHLENITIESFSNGVGAQNTGIIGNAEGDIIKNFTANNVKISIYNKTSETYIGGISGYGSADIENSYINNLYIEESNNTNIMAVGGIIGYSNSNAYDIKNTYVSGNININSGTVGGIIGWGYASIITSFADVNIIANGDYVGGLTGREVSATGISSNNLYIGDIINKKAEGIVGALVGNNIVGTNNYCYYANKINGEVVEGTNKLTNQDLRDANTYTAKLKFDNNYEYSNVLNGILPMLKYIDSDQLLPNQKDIYLPTEELVIEDIQTLKMDNNNLQVQVVVTNPTEYAIKDIVIDDMEYSIISNRTSKGKTYITLKATPIKYYDTYRISKITYEADGKEESKEVFDLIEESFFKELTSYEDWQAIDENSYENYRLLADIDFAGKTNIKSNLRINKLVTEGQVHTLKNINLDVTNVGFGLINECKNLMENIKFENINLSLSDQSISGNYVGIIVKNSGNIKNITFKDVTISLNDKISYVGCISNNIGLYIENVNLENINITGARFVGSLFGRANATYIRGINANSVNINGTTTVGGIIGYRDRLTNDELSNITIKDSKISGQGDIGGIYGSTGANSYTVENIEVINCQIEGDSNVGGVAGSSGYNTNAIKYVKVKDSTIIGTTNVGGIFGTGGNLQYAIVEDSKIIANDVNSSKIGGITGNIGWSITYSGVLNTTIQTLGTSVGGVIGYGNSATRVYALDSTVEGYSKVGGLVGETVTGSLDYSYTNADVIAIQDYAGGIAGYLENTNMDNQTNVIRIRNDYYAGGTIKGKQNVGGIIGGIAKELYDTETSKNYFGNYVEATLLSEDKKTTSLGIGSNSEENKNIVDTYYYKYSNINGENPNEQNEEYISREQYLVNSDLKLRTTYVEKLQFSTGNWNFDVLENNKYPVLHVNNVILEGQNGIDLPIDEEHIVETASSNDVQSIDAKDEKLEQTFEYNNKTIQTYSTYSVITDVEGNKVVRNAKLYVKDNNLYGIPSVLNSEASEEVIRPVANNLILDSYNGKEYETILGSDGQLYDLKEHIEYPENFINEAIESIGNNLNSDTKEVEVIYKNGDKIKFDYQTGKVISSSEAGSEKTRLFDYLKEKISEIGNDTSDVDLERATKYEESQELKTKLEETSVEEAIEKQNNLNKIENGITTDENNTTNNSLKENKYISMYNQEKGEYEIYDEKELLDTSQEEVVSENEKIEANNLKEYYASEGETKNTKMGIVWIVISIIGVGIILFALRRNLKKKNA